MNQTIKVNLCHLCQLMSTYCLSYSSLPLSSPGFLTSTLKHQVLMKLMH